MTVFAIPARKGILTRTLPDGTTIEYCLHGDENFHYMTLTDGTLVTTLDDGFVYYAKATEKGIVALPYKVGESMPAKFKSNSAQAASLSRLKEIQANRRNAALSASRIQPVSGDINNQPGLVILIEFPDVEMKYSNQNYTDLLNKEDYTDLNHTGSAHDYFKASSFGQYRPKFDVYGPFLASGESTYYGKNNLYGDDSHVPDLIVEACRLAHDSGVDLSKYDYNNDGKIDCVYVFYAGEGEANGGAESTIWPHRWIIDLGKNFKGDPTVGGVTVYDYACSNEICTDYKDKIGTDFDGVGTFIHEFGHVFGLPDLYCTGDYPVSPTLEIYDVMAGGNYLNYSRTPPAYSAYERMFMGWLSPEQIFPSPEGDEITLPVIGEGKALLLTENGQKHNMDGLNPDPSIFYLLESRQADGWDKYMNHGDYPDYATVGDQGLLITKVQYDKMRWEDNIVNINSSAMGVAYVYNTGQYRPWAFYPMFPGKYSQTEIKFGSYTIRDIARDDKTGAVSFTISDSNGESSVTGTAAARQISVTGSAGRIIIDGQFSEAAVFSPQGALVYRGSEQEISLPQGIYIVNVDGIAAKAIVR